MSTLEETFLPSGSEEKETRLLNRVYRDFLQFSKSVLMCLGRDILHKGIKSAEGIRPSEKWGVFSRLMG
jgi:hypothetical protein